LVSFPGPSTFWHGIKFGASVHCPASRLKARETGTQVDSFSEKHRIAHFPRGIFFIMRIPKRGFT
jgi:hypothetical protein